MSNASKIILLTGYKSSGKDTAGEYLVSHHGYTRLAMADALKDHVSRKYGIPRYYFDDRRYKEEPLTRFPLDPKDKTSKFLCFSFGGYGLSPKYWTPRALLIMEGSVARAVDPSFWVGQVLQEIHTWPERNYVVTDVRYRSELELIKVTHPSARTVCIYRGESNSSDASERDLDHVETDFLVVNTGTKEELYSKLEEIL